VSGNGIDCGATCSKLLEVNTAVSLSATAAGGTRFAGWSGPCTGTAGCSFTLSADSTVAAEFTKQWQLSVYTDGTGTGTVSVNGIDCGSPCSMVFDQGTAVSLAASPGAGSVFTGWSGDCTGTGACSPRMDAARSVTATFVPSTQQYTLNVTVTGSGSVTGSPRGINCGRKCSDAFTVGTSVTLTAKPKGKHNFLGWTGACAGNGTSLTCTIPMVLHDEAIGADFD
jgi:hypothetical protein